MGSLSFTDNDDIQVKGATDGALIGNVGDRMKVATETNRYTNIVGNTTVVVKDSPGVLRAIMINNNATGGGIIVYDNTVGSGARIATLQIGTPSGGLLSASGLPGPVSLADLNMEFNTGLTIVTFGSSSNNITVLYR